MRWYVYHRSRFLGSVWARDARAALARARDVWPGGGLTVSTAPPA